MVSKRTPCRNCRRTSSRQVLERPRRIGRIVLDYATGKAGFDLAGGFASNGYGARFPRRLQHGGLPDDRSRADVHVS